VSELPTARDTLLLRLLGAGSVLKQAIAELEALPADAPERVLALPILVRLRLAVPIDPAKQTNDDQEFLMTTQDIVETWRQEAIQEGIKQGLERGVQQGLERGVQQGLERGVQQGLERGVQQGLERGVQQGLEQGERKLLVRQLRRRFGNLVDGEVERRLNAASIEQLELWADRVLTAATLAELLAD
jgi:flagellar biosynthesis/type III secretory pathway protein FliH